MNTPYYNIAAVERETGLSKDVLRMWERRYGFPAPERDAHGERSYPAPQVERLRLIKRLLDQGHRPGKLLSLDDPALHALAPRRSGQRLPPAPDSEISNLLGLLRQHDTPALAQALQQRLTRDGLARFVQDSIAPLTREVGAAWERGELQVFEEHLFTEQAKRVLRQAIGSLHGRDGRPRILLTTPPDELHALGLLMAEALLTLDGAECIPLGTQMPVGDIVRAAAAHRADIVALSFSQAYPGRQVTPLLQQLRQQLPATTVLWAGGAGVQRLSSSSGIQLLPDLADAGSALAAWRRLQASGGGDADLQ